MGCVGSKKEEKAPGKGARDAELNNPAHTAHYVKDPTATNSKGVSVSRSDSLSSQCYRGNGQARLDPSRNRDAEANIGGCFCYEHVIGVHQRWFSWLKQSLCSVTAEL